MLTWLELDDGSSATLITWFGRVALAGRGGSDRMTGDLGVALVGSGGARGGDASQLVLAETKSETERAEADRELVRVGGKPVSLSEYRVRDGPGRQQQQAGAQPGSELFD